MRLSFNQGLLILLAIGSVGPYGSYSAAILGATLVGAEAFKYFKEIKQAEADLKTFEAKFDEYKKAFDAKVSSLESRVSTFVAMGRMK